MSRDESRLELIKSPKQIDNAYFTSGPFPLTPSFDRTAQEGQLRSLYLTFLLFIMVFVL